MEHTLLDIYTLFYNVRQFVKRKKAGDINWSRIVPRFVYEKNPPHVKGYYKKFWNEYANYFFTYHELKLFLLYEYLFNDDVFVINISSKDVKNISQILSKEQYEKDIYFLTELNKKIGNDNIKNLFKFNEAGENPIYMLTKKKTISPMVYIEYIDKIEVNDTNEDYKKFTKIIRKLKHIITEKRNNG